MKKSVIWPLVIGIGVANAIVLVAFEFVGIDITDWLWNDLFNTDEHRWLVLPVAVGLGLVLTAAIIALRDKRVVEPESDLMDDMNNGPATFGAMGVVLTIGALSLLAGGSIGPEASLMAASAAIGAIVASKSQLNDQKQLLILASIGALLVAFIGSMLLVAVPLLILFQMAKKQAGRIQLKSVLLILVAGIASWLVIWAKNELTGKSGGYGTHPVLPNLVVHDFAVALVLGFVAGFLALGMNWLIKRFWRFASWLDSQKLPAKDWVVGIVFSLVLGCLYLLGGQTVEFSGSVGTSLLVQNAAQYSALALVGMIIVKVTVTAWSKGTGYRGGLVFPSIYSGVALGLLVGQLYSGFAGAGAMIGGIAAMMTAAVGSPIIAAIFLVAILPAKLWPVAACAIAGTMAFSLLSKRFGGGHEQ